MANSTEVELANQRAAALLSRTPTAVSARYDNKSSRLVIGLSSRVTVSVSPDDVQGLRGAKPSHLSDVEINPSGLGLHFPQLDADIYLPALLEGVLGSRAWMAARLGHRGGSARSGRKRAAARRNGRLGGRPAKAARR